MKGAKLKISALVAWIAVLPFAVQAAGLPARLLSGLKSEEFKQREQAQADLVEWAKRRPEMAMAELFKQSRVADDPEVRERCLAVLRELANDEYLKEGDGYVGIQMRDEITTVPGDPKPRGAIRVVAVVPESAADHAGLRLNDLIVGLNDQVWHEGSALLPFSEAIRKLKPKSKITLKTLRKGELMQLEVTLGRRPDDQFLEQWPTDMEAAERASREAHFQRLLERRKFRD